MADIPQWALDRAGAMCGYSPRHDKPASGWWEWESTQAFARYIAAHEEPPASVELLEARKMLAEDHAHNGLDLVSDGTLYKLGAANDAIMSGKYDLDYRARNYLRAIKRGMELAK